MALTAWPLVHAHNAACGLTAIFIYLLCVVCDHAPCRGFGVILNRKSAAPQIKVPQLASMLSWGSRSGADESPPNLTRFVTQSASAFDTAEMARHAKARPLASSPIAYCHWVRLDMQSTAA